MAAKKPLGVLILHGFTSSLDNVRGLVPVVEALDLPWRMPVLRGHCTRCEDLVGVTPQDWYADAEAALAELRREAERVVVVGLSMGALLTLQLAMEHPEDLDSVVAASTIIRAASPTVHLTPLLKRLFSYWDWGPITGFNDPELAKTRTSYKRFPTLTFAALLDYMHAIERRLPEVRVPALILHSRKDMSAHPISAKIVHDRIRSTDKRLVWFERSGHEVFMDMEREAVLRVVGDHLEARLAALAPQESSL